MKAPLLWSRPGAASGREGPSNQKMLQSHSSPLLVLLTQVFVDIRSHPQYTSSFFYLPPYTLSLPWHFSFNSPQKAVPIYSIFPFSIFEEMSFES